MKPSSCARRTRRRAPFRRGADRASGGGLRRGDRSGVVLPGVVASFAARRDAAAQARIESRASASRSNANALAQTTAALRALADYSNSRQSMVLLLAEITRSLPDSSSLVAFQVDSTGLGSVVAVSPHAAAIVDAVERTPGLASPQISARSRESASADVPSSVCRCAFSSSREAHNDHSGWHAHHARPANVGAWHHDHRGDRRFGACGTGVAALASE